MRLCEDVDRQVRPGDCFALLLHDLERHPGVVPVMLTSTVVRSRVMSSSIAICVFPTELRPNGFELAARNMKRLGAIPHEIES